MRARSPQAGSGVGPVYEQSGGEDGGQHRALGTDADVVLCCWEGQAVLAWWASLWKGKGGKKGCDSLPGSARTM